MTEESLAPPSGAIIPEDLQRLLTAARAALRLLSDLDKHLPQDAPRLGNEGRVRRQLREAIRLASFEVRRCDDFDGGGEVPDPDAAPMQRPALVTCPSCGGDGGVRVFVYERPKARRGR